jgi:lipopolysaccharide/colanic/teichoic acid biosynthesis glycosyltransferase
VKRIFDMVVSGIGLVCLSPMFLLLAIWIKIDTSGPIFYRQSRVGKCGKDFWLYKFRSMKTDADKKGLITIGGRDPRVTRSGYYIRKYKLDEFPQLINVFIGDMSFVGPRPEVRKYVDFYTPEQKQVLSVRPGITDMASVKYRNENEILGKVDNPEAYYRTVILQDKLKINQEYLNKSSFWFDILLIIKTIGAIIKK